jgi:excisionase family DNA binding protein
MEIYTIPELATKLHVRQRTARRYLREGRLQARKVARRWLITEDALRSFLLPDAETGRHGARE